MTDSGGLGREAAHERWRRFRTVLAALLRASGSTVALVAIYYVLPLDDTSVSAAVGMLVLALLALVGVVALQVRSIIRATYPALRAVEALATSVPLFLLVFAATYFVMGSISAGSFSESMTRTDALYFTVTVFATVGFGDITAKTELARALVIGQMVADIIIFAIVARIIVGAVKQRQHQQPWQHADSGPE